MNTLKNKHRNGNGADLYGDVEKIKEALFVTTRDLKGKTAEFFNDSKDEVKDKVVYAKNAVGKYTEKRPFKSLGIAMAVGVAIGYLLRK